MDDRLAFFVGWYPGIFHELPQGSSDPAEGEKTVSGWIEARDGVKTFSRLDSRTKNSLNRSQVAIMRTRTSFLEQTLTLVLSLVTASAGFGQVGLVYDNQIATVNNGRVNDPDFPVFLMHADDFSLSANCVINQVSWLGAYKDGNLLPDGDDNFTIRFFGFQGATPSATPFATFAVGTAERHVTPQTLLYGNPIFSYSARFPDLQMAGGTYLMAIMNNPIDNDLWLWCDADASPGHSYMMLFEGTPWGEYSGGGVAEFAFSISYVPEPSGAAMILLGGSIFGVLHLRPRSRKNGQQTRCSEPGDGAPVGIRGSAAPGH